MAKVTITINDAADKEGDVEVSFDSEPGWPGPAMEDTEMTPAQYFGTLLMTEFDKIINSFEGQKKDIELVGKDEFGPVNVSIIDEDAEAE